MGCIPLSKNTTQEALPSSIQVDFVQLTQLPEPVDDAETSESDNEEAEDLVQQLLVPSGSLMNSRLTWKIWVE